MDKLVFITVMILITINSCSIKTNKNDGQIVDNTASIIQERIESKDSIQREEVVFESNGVLLAGTVLKPNNPKATLVIVHGSDQVPRMLKFALLLAQHNFQVLTYDKRGVGKSGGVYAGPEVGTNNISVENLNLLAKDASAAIELMHIKSEGLPIGLIGASQAGWIIPIAARENPLVEFMVLFSAPTISTLEQLRFQFYTQGKVDFWDHHTEAEARYHTMNDPDKYQFEATDPKESLKALSIPSLWLFGERDVQVPVKLCIDQLNALKRENKPFDYILFPSLGHNTQEAKPIDFALKWVVESALINKE